MKVHFIAIGGSVMHQLALALQAKGYQVTGSDDEIFEPARTNLQKAGLLPATIGWNPDLVTPDLNAVILGMHAKSDNPELLRATSLGLTIHSFPGYIYEESRDKKRVVVGGSHGKTTTTAMIMHVLKKTGLEFDFLVGAKLEGFERSVRITNAPVIVCEGDEYPASALEKRPKFHFLIPHIAILTGIAWDHINVFPTFPFYLEQFVIFVNKIVPGGILIYNETDEELKTLVKRHFRKDIRYQPYGIPQHAIAEGETKVHLEGMEGNLKVFGNHNLLNLNAAWYAVRELEIPVEKFLQAIADFTGASKRLELLGQNQWTNVYRDFAHAPSKVKATIEAVKKQFPGRKLVAVLELHTYSSLNEEFMEQYHGAMALADLPIVFYAAHALELKRLPPLPVEKVVAGFGHDNLTVMNVAEGLMRFLKGQSYENTNVLFMSSGNYDGADILTFAQEITRG
ncbi:MAG TPA: Mur ligase family protein [Flavitalea sp.]|nr:Mur ligase family protein [Flavitalea sp.]